MWRLLGCLAAALPAGGLLACGSAHPQGRAGVRSPAVRSDAATPTGASSPRESLAAPLSGDGDGDSPERSTFDSDDFHSMHFGYAADAQDRRTITALIKRYYAALAREDGATVCSLLLEVVAESMPETQRAQTGGPAAAQTASTCPAAVTPVLAASHRSLVEEDSTLEVIGARVRRRRASAILRFRHRAARHILLYKEEGRWKIGTLADEDLG